MGGDSHMFMTLLPSYKPREIEREKYTRVSQNPPAQVTITAKRGKLMADDLSRFKGLLPYASELMGIYQPLLGWRSKLRRMRISQEAMASLRQVLTSMLSDKRFTQAV